MATSHDVAGPTEQLNSLVYYASCAIKETPPLSECALAEKHL